MQNLLSTVREHFDALPNWAKYAIVGVPALVILKQLGNRPRKSPYKSDWKQGIVYLYQFQRSDSLPSLSSFCLKLETWLRIADVPYENVRIPLFGVRSKEGTLPFAELNGIEYPDSSFAIRDLTRILGKEHLEKDFSPQQAGASRAIEKMVEASALYSYTYVRYVEKWGEMAAEMSKYEEMNNIFYRCFFYILTPFMKSKIKKTFFLMGLSKHPREEILNIGFDDLRALSQYLGENKYIMGDNATKVDAAVFGVLSQIIYLTVHTPHLDMIKAECTNLIEYAERMKSEYWPDWDEACGKKLLDTDWKSFKKEK